MARATPELSLHISVADLLRNYARPGVLWFHVPNGGKMSPQRGARLKKMGVKAGVPDFVILSPDDDTAATRVVFIELKSDKGRLSPAQLEFSSRAMDAMCAYFTVRDLDDAASLFTGMGLITKNPFDPNYVIADSRSSVLRRHTA